jgi:uncharacterized protein
VIWRSGDSEKQLSATIYHRSLGRRLPPMLSQAILALSPPAIAGLVAVLIAGGSAKGALGIGLPLVSVPLTAQFLDLPVVIGLLSVPMIATNIGQAMESRGTLPALARLWPMLATIMLGTWAWVYLLLGIDRHLLNAVVGPILVLLAGWLLFQPRITLGRSAERWAGPLVGFLAGVCGGMAGMFGPPLIAYLVGLGLHPDLFVKYISILFLAATGTLVLALGGMGSLSPADLAVSAAALIPIQLGVIIGRWLRRRCPAPVFRGLVLLVLALGGLDILRRAVL